MNDPMTRRFSGCVRGVEAGRGEDIDAHLRRGNRTRSRTMLAGAAAINELNALRIPTFLEPLL